MFDLFFCCSFFINIYNFYFVFFIVFDFCLINFSFYFYSIKYLDYECLRSVKNKKIWFVVLLISLNSFFFLFFFHLSKCDFQDSFIIFYLSLLNVSSLSFSLLLILRKHDKKVERKTKRNACYKVISFVVGCWLFCD